MSQHQFNVVVLSYSKPANNVVLTSTPFHLTKHRLDHNATEAQESHPKRHPLQMQKEDLVGNADHLEHCYPQLQNEFDKTQHLNEQYRKEKNDLIKEKSDLEHLAESHANKYATLLKEKEKLAGNSYGISLYAHRCNQEQLAEKLEYTIEQRDIEILDLRETIEETDQANTVDIELQSDKVDRLTAIVSHLVTNPTRDGSERERDVSRKHAEMIAQEARSVATDMQAKEAALTEHETEIASLRNQIKKGKYKRRLTVNDNHDANDESPEPTPGASSSSTSIPSNNHSIHDLITDTLVQFMTANPLLHASPASSTPKRRKAQNPHPNVGSVKANCKLKQSELATLKPEDKVGWKLTGQTHVSHFKKYNPVTTEIAKQYDLETGPGPQGANQFQLYFGDGWCGSRWNLGIVKNMTSIVLVNSANQRFEGSLSTEGICAIIWGYISQARDSWSKQKPRMHEEERDRFETVAEAATRAQIDQVKRYKSVRKANCEHGQSLDDTDVEVEGSALVTMEPYGHRRFLSRILADLDSNINELQSKIAVQHGKKHLAHPTQICCQTGQKTQPKAIICLPQSLYHCQFLAHLSPASVERLEINEKCLPHLPDFKNWALAEQANSDSEAATRDDSPLILHYSI
ncbi:hypothetical protein BT96DRAFT_1000439 [Gymnopus androsaceus JB14]|uniref:Uncharacterized protein n=1 Tax=Gymnopus androsaceus JB14 TaxID=1447944 RepID=A0A6A4H3J2_9AGAR|nr:hypothetical protein BT96DRAFT_1000439 [Gymnopus androsaceus JB14]